MRYLFLFLLSALLLFSKTSKGKDNSFYTLSYKAGTLGFGLDLSYYANKTFGTRLNFNGYSDTRHLSIEQKRYRMQGLLNSTGLIFDIHPWQNSFMFSWGAYYSKSHLKFINKPKSGKIVVGNHSYSSMQVGKAVANIKLKRRINPYFGIGFSSVDKNDKWHFVMDLGAVYIGTPKAKVTAKPLKGFEALGPIMEKESHIEEKNLNRKIEKFKVYPIISIGIGYNF